MAKLIIGFLIGAGAAFTFVSIWAKEEQKKIDAWEKWRAKLP